MKKHFSQFVFCQRWTSKRGIYCRCRPCSFLRERRCSLDTDDQRLNQESIFYGFSLFFHGVLKVFHCWFMVFSKNWISKNWKSIDIHCWTSINEYQWISINEYQWISINEFIDGPSMNMVPFLRAPFFGPFFGPIGPPLGPGGPVISCNPGWPLQTHLF